MKPYQRNIEAVIKDILRDNNISEAPIKVEELINNYSIEIEEYDLGEDVSGLLAIKGDKAKIAINTGESPYRKRFTLAHEFGHYILHKDSRDLFVENNNLLMFRNEESSSGEIKMERQANAFAASLLMPYSFVMKEIADNDYDFRRDEHSAVEKLAEKFQVSTMAMTFRLVNLGYIRH